MIPNPQSPIPNPQSDDWLPIDRVARLTGLSERHWRRLAGRLFHRSLARRAAPPSGRGRPVWWISRAAHPKLARPDRPSLTGTDQGSLLTKYPQTHVERACRRLYWLKKWRTACEHPRIAGETDRCRAARIVAEARRIEPEAFKISIRSLQLWRRAHQRGGVEALVDRYRAHAGPERSPEAVEFFYSVYRCRNGPSVRICHNVTRDEAKRKEWLWPRGYSATARWLRENDDYSLSYLMRAGPKRWAHKYLPHLEIDYTRIEPGEFYICDHTQVDFWCSYRGRQIRPWLTAVEDLRSRCIVGWHLGPAPHQDAILCALRMAYRDWAIPERMRIDNGKDFTSKLLTGISKSERDQLRRLYGRNWQRVLRRDADLVTCDDGRWLGIIGELGIELIYAIPYSPWSKGPIERWFGTFEDQCGRTFATYCGNSALAKPECLEEIRRGYSRSQKRDLRRRYGRDWKRIAVLKFIDQGDVPTLEEARQHVGKYIELYHHNEHRGRGMNGRTPLEVWQTAARLRRAVDDALLFLMDIRGRYSVGANGVRLTVGANTPAYGARNPALQRWIGREVLIAMDARDTGQCWALDPNKRTLIARLEANETVPPYTTADDHREAIAEIKREQSVMHKAGRAAAQCTRTATQRIRRHQQERLAELRRTGTDDAGPRPNIVPVRTGFEGVVKAHERASKAAPKRPARDLTASLAALAYGHRSLPAKEIKPRSTLEILAPAAIRESASPEDEESGDSGTDAGQRSSDVLSLVAEHRHDRE